MRTRVAILVVLVLCGVAAPRRAFAQGVALAQDLETSIRAAGMGGATTAVGWGEPGPWGNAASLAGTSGLAWLMGNTEGLYGDVKFETRRMLLGGEGLGFTLMGQPIEGMGGSRIEYTFEGTDPFGNPVYRNLFQQVDGWGFGVSPVQVADFVRQRRGESGRPWSERLDVSFGFQQKDTEVEFAPGLRGSASNWDWGVMGTFAVLPGVMEEREARLEFGAGYAVLNADDQSEFDPGSPGGAVYSPNLMKRLGVALHATLPFGGAHEQGGSAWDWWEATVPRTVELGFAYDQEEVSSGSSGSSSHTEHVGFEARLMGILAARTGYVDPPSSDLDGWTFGFGVHLPIGPWASLGYDWASIPTPEGIDTVYRQGFAFWLHPVVLWKNARE